MKCIAPGPSAVRARETSFIHEVYRFCGSLLTYDVGPTSYANQVCSSEIPAMFGRKLNRPGRNEKQEAENYLN
jgi:hypothetical protein